MPDHYPNVVIIRTLGDPRSAVYAWAAELAYYGRAKGDGDYALVVASGDEESFPVTGGSLTKSALRIELWEISQHYDIPIYLFDKQPRATFFPRLSRALPKNPVLHEMPRRRSLSYGGATNEGFLWASVLGAERAFFFDDDIRPMTDFDVIQHHGDILNKGAVAVTGGYTGTHWLDTTFLPNHKMQEDLKGALMHYIPTQPKVEDSPPLNTRVPPKQ